MSGDRHINPDWHALIWSALEDQCKTIRGEASNSTILSDPTETQMPCKRHKEDLIGVPPGNRGAALHLLHKLRLEPNGPTEIHTFFKDLEEKGHASLTQEGLIVIRRVINSTDEDTVGVFQRWVHQLMTHERSYISTTGGGDYSEPWGR